MLSASCGRIGYEEAALRATPGDASTGGSGGNAGSGGSANDSAAEDTGVTTEAGTDASADSALETGVDSGVDSAIDDGGPLVVPTGLLGRGFHQTCFIKNGRLYCWGQNDFGQLGLGDVANRNVPTAIGAGTDWADMCGGEYHSCALRANGELYCWGRNSKGQLGIGSLVDQRSPVRVAGFSDFTHLTCNSELSCALRRSGALYCWGDNLEGAPGLADADGAAHVTSPQPVAGGLRFTQASTGQGHTCGLRNDGALFCWGRNTNGQLGIDSVGGHLRTPTRVGTDTNWLNVAAGQGQTCGVRQDGTLWCWGIDAAGSLGLNVTTDTVVPRPTQVGTLRTWRQASASRLHTCATTLDGAVYCWGRGVEGQLGIGFVTESRVPARIGVDSTWQQVGAGGFHTCARRADQSAWCWGENMT
ncbi:MAG TPA: hypothetical protein VK524_09300, partial [Polyangiaceae bacterium]|nr:hypothetical protein [Polyangiaceae bacterium]